MLWRDHHGDLAVYLEGMRRYPVADYFHTRHRNRSLPAMLRLIEEAASAVRWGLPGDHPAVRDPWLPGLLEAYQQATREISARFLTAPPLTVTPPVSRATCEGSGEPRDSVRALREVEAMMIRLAGVAQEPGAARFERSQHWWRIAGPTRAFAHAVPGFRHRPPIRRHARGPSVSPGVVGAGVLSPVGLVGARAAAAA